MQKVRHTIEVYISILTKSFDSSLLRMKDNLLKNNVQLIRYFYMVVSFLFI